MPRAFSHFSMAHKMSLLPAVSVCGLCWIWNGHLHHWEHQSPEYRRLRKAVFAAFSSWTHWSQKKCPHCPPKQKWQFPTNNHLSIAVIDFNTQPAVWESPSVGRRHGREGKWEVSIRQENGLTAGCIHTTLHVNYVSMPGCRLQLWERHYEPHGGVSQEMLYSPLSSIHKFKIVKWRAVTSEKLAERRSWDIQTQHDVPQFGCDKNGVFASALIHFLFCFPSSPWEWLFFFSFYFSFTIFLMGSR